MVRLWRMVPSSTVAMYVFMRAPCLLVLDGLIIQPNQESVKPQILETLDTRIKVIYPNPKIQHNHVYLGALIRPVCFWYYVP